MSDSRSAVPHRALAAFLVECCGAVNRGESLTLDHGNVELRVIPGDSVELPDLDPPLDAVVVFAGSNDWRDWVRNASVLQRRCSVHGGRVHSGFEKDFLTVRSILLERLHHAKRVAIAGHSRAHPLACRLAEELDAIGPEVAFVMTFGGPRWCDAARRDRYNARGIPTFRFVVGWDAVPRWPKLGYRHVGKMICLSTRGELRKSQRAPSLLRPWRWLWSAVDEHIVANEYARAIKAWSAASGETSSAAAETLTPEEEES